MQTVSHLLCEVICDFARILLPPHSQNVSWLAVLVALHLVSIEVQASNEFLLAG